MSSEASTSPNLPGVFGRLGRYFRGGTTYLPAALYGGEVVGSGQPPTSTPASSGEVGRSGTPDRIIAPQVQAILRTAAQSVAAFDDHDLADHLADLASDYAGPACTDPRSNHGDGRGCQDDLCPRHGDPYVDPEAS